MLQKRSRLSRSGTYVAPEGRNKVRSLSPGVRELTALGSLSKNGLVAASQIANYLAMFLPGGGGTHGIPT